MNRLDPFEIPLAGAYLIEANAGTGKTFTITTLYVRLLLERELQVGQILVVTYTNAATAELRRKLRARVGEALAALRAGGDPTESTLAELVRRRRAAGRVAEDCQRLQAALYAFDDAAIFTIHGFCQRVLQEHAFETGMPFDVELLGDERLLVEEVLRDFWGRELYAAPAELVHFLNGRHVGPTTLTPLARLAAAHPGLRVLPARPQVNLPAAIAAGAGVDDALGLRLQQLEIDLVAQTPPELRRRKEERNAQSFDDLLQRVDDALAGSGGPDLAAQIRARFPAALIDEFQDTDPVQYRIFDALYRRGGTLYLIGDPKQAIYAFRGADVFAYMRAKQDVGEHVYTLETNRRSSPALVRAVNTLFAGARAPFVFDGIPFLPSAAAADAKDALGGAAAGRAPLRMLFVPRPVDAKAKQMKSTDLGWLHRAVAGEIVRLLDADTRIRDKRVAPGDVAVLCRTNEQTRDMQAALSDLGVPSVLHGDASVFDTVDAEAVERVIRAVADPSDDAAIAAALVTRIVGLTGDALAAARRDEQQWEQWVARFQSWHELWRSSGFPAAFRAVLDGCGAPRRILAQPGGERCLTNVLHLGELLQTAALDARRGPLALVEWLRRMQADDTARAEAVAESAQIRLESDAFALKLVTIHKSKGLQYPVVVCPFLWGGMLLHANDKKRIRFHDPEDDDRLSLDLGSAQHDAHLELATREALAENLRLLYVALTRAEQLCIAVWGQFRECQCSPLGYLLHQPADVAQEALREATMQRIKRLSDGEMRRDLERLAANSAGAVEVIDLSDEPAPHFHPPDGGVRALRLQTMSHDVRQRWRMASFSALASMESALPEPAEEGVDRDEMADSVPATEALPAVRGFPRGRRIGNLVHKLFESIDFVERDPAVLRAHAVRLLPAYGVELQWTDTLCDAVADVLDTPLTATAPPLTLRQIAANRRLTELEFVFPVALAADEAAAGTVSAVRLGDVFAAHGAPWLAGYAERVRRLPFGPLSGYLKGYVDLVFAHGERWYIVDYKTNDLGGRAEDYRRPRLLAEMERHHYLLQYHLYAVALHRYLTQRLRGYDYERHFGGVLYLFVRGMAPAHEPGCGIFRDRPSPALIGALSDLLAQPTAGRGDARS